MDDLMSCNLICRLLSSFFYAFFVFLVGWRANALLFWPHGCNAEFTGFSIHQAPSYLNRAVTAIGSRGQIGDIQRARENEVI
jgi:hypothetical protein